MAVTRRKKWLIYSGIGAALLVVVSAILWEVSKARCFALTGDVICRVETDRPVVALSFDDGPTGRGVDWVLPTLEDHGARATFFLTGAESEAAPQLVRRLAEAGHEIGNHSFSHNRMMWPFSGGHDEEIRRASAAIAAAGAPLPSFFRPPYGKKLIGLPRAVERQGLRMVTWDVEDPSEAANGRAYADRVLEQVRPGSIILMHVMYPGNRTARDALPLILEGLRSRGYRVVPVGELIDGSAASG